MGSRYILSGTQLGILKVLGTNKEVDNLLHLLEEIEEKMIECWDSCHEIATEDAKCADFSPSVLEANDQVWRKWIEDDLVSLGRTDVREAFDRWYPDNPLRSTSEDFCIVYRKIGRVQAYKSNHPKCSLTSMDEICI